MQRNIQCLIVQKAEKKVIDDNQGRGTKEKTKERELDAKFFERLTHLYFKHRTKKKLFGSSMKLDKANFWKEVGSLEWARKGFGMSKKHLSLIHTLRSFYTQLKRREKISHSLFQLSSLF